MASTARSKAASSTSVPPGSPSPAPGAVTGNRWRVPSTDPTRSPTDVAGDGAEVHRVGDVGVHGVSTRVAGAGRHAVHLATERERQVGRRLDPRAGHRVAAERLEGDRHLDQRGLDGPARARRARRAGSTAAVPGRGRRPPTPGPRPVSAPASRLSRAAAKSRWSSSSSNLMVPSSGRTSRGRPRIRSATMLRWISFVPA